MWTVVYISQNNDVAQKIHDLLESSGVLVKMRQVNSENGEAGSFEILVPETEVEEAHNIILDNE